DRPGAAGAVDLAVDADAGHREVGGRQVLDAQLAGVVGGADLVLQGRVAVDRRDELIHREHGGGDSGNAVGRRRVVGNSDRRGGGGVAGRDGEIGAVGAADVDAGGRQGGGIDTTAAETVDSGLERGGLARNSVGERVDHRAVDRHRLAVERREIGVRRVVHGARAGDGGGRGRGGELVQRDVDRSRQGAAGH